MHGLITKINAFAKKHVTLHGGPLPASRAPLLLYLRNLHSSQLSILKKQISIIISNSYISDQKLAMITLKFITGLKILAFLLFNGEIEVEERARWEGPSAMSDVLLGKFVNFSNKGRTSLIALGGQPLLSSDGSGVQTSRIVN